MRKKLFIIVVFLLTFIVFGCKKSNSGSMYSDKEANIENMENSEEASDMGLSSLQAKDMDRRIRPLLEKAVGNVKLVHFGKAPMGGWMHMYRTDNVDTPRAVEILRKIIEKKGFKYCIPFGIDIVWIEGKRGNRKLIRVAFPSIQEITLEYVIESEDPDEFKTVFDNLRKMSVKCREAFSQ